MTDVDYQLLHQQLETEKTLREQREWIAALEADNIRLSAQLKAAQAREASVCKMYQGELLSKGSIMGELANAKGMVIEVWNWAIRSGPALSQRQTMKLLKALELVLSGKGAVVEEFTRDMLICQALAHVIAAKQLMGEADGKPDDEDTEPITPITFEPDETQEVPVIIKTSGPQESPEKVAGEGSPATVEAMGNKQLLVLGKEGPAFSQQQIALSKAEDTQGVIPEFEIGDKVQAKAPNGRWIYEVYEILSRMWHVKGDPYPPEEGHWEYECYHFSNKTICTFRDSELRKAQSLFQPKDTSEVAEDEYSTHFGQNYVVRKGKIPRWPANTASAEEQAVYSSRFGQPGRIVSGQVPRDFREGETTILESREERVQAEFDRIMDEGNAILMDRLAMMNNRMIYLPYSELDIERAEVFA